jgi:hypothetical protein
VAKRLLKLLLLKLLLLLPKLLLLLLLPKLLLLLLLPTQLLLLLLTLPLLLQSKQLAYGRQKSRRKSAFFISGIRRMHLNVSRAS